MANIGAYTFKSVSGIVEPAGMQLQDISRPGTDGSAWREEGTKAPLCRLETMSDHEDIADSQAAFAGYKMMEGQLVAVLTTAGDAYVNVLIHSVRAIRRKPVGAIVGGLNVSNGDEGVIQTAEWTVQQN